MFLYISCILMYKNMFRMLPVTRAFAFISQAGPIVVQNNRAVGDRVGAPPSGGAGAIELP